MSDDTNADAIAATSYLRETPKTGALLTQLSLAQAKFKNPPQNKTATKRWTNKRGEEKEMSYKYASFDKVLDAVRGPLAEFGIAFLQAIHTIDNRQILVTKLAYGAAEQWIESCMPLPSLSNVSNQDFAGDVTYFKRYVLSGMLGICADQDDDATRSAETKPDHAEPSRRRGPARETSADSRNWPAMPEITDSYNETVLAQVNRMLFNLKDLSDLESLLEYWTRNNHAILRARERTEGLTQWLVEQIKRSELPRVFTQERFSELLCKAMRASRLEHLNLMETAMKSGVLAELLGLFQRQQPKLHGYFMAAIGEEFRRVEKLFPAAEAEPLRIGSARDPAPVSDAEMVETEARFLSDDQSPQVDQDPDTGVEGDGLATADENRGDSGFAYTLTDEFGEPLGSYERPDTTAMAFVERWETAGPDTRLALQEMNADVLMALSSYPEARTVLEATEPPPENLLVEVVLNASGSPHIASYVASVGACLKYINGRYIDAWLEANAPVMRTLPFPTVTGLMHRVNRRRAELGLPAAELMARSEEARLV